MAIFHQLALAAPLLLQGVLSYTPTIPDLRYDGPTEAPEFITTTLSDGSVYVHSYTYYVAGAAESKTKLLAFMMSTVTGPLPTGPARQATVYTTSGATGVSTVVSFVTVAPQAVPAPDLLFSCSQGAGAASLSCTCNDGSTHPTLAGPNACGYTAPPTAQSASVTPDAGASEPTLPVITLGGVPVTAAPTGFVVTPSGGAPVSVLHGGPAVTIGTDIVSLDGDGTLAVNSKTIELGSGTAPASTTGASVPPAPGDAGGNVPPPPGNATEKPSLAPDNIVTTLVEEGSNGVLITITKTLARTTYTDFASLASTTIITTTVANAAGASTVIPVIIGPGGVAFQESNSLPSKPTIPAPRGTVTSGDTKPPETTAADETIAPDETTGPLTTFTVFPSVSIETATGVTTDGATTIMGSDGKATPLPIIKPNCFFCPPGIDSGLVLKGLKPGVYPPGPPPPGWPSPIPAITVGPNGNPTYSSTPDASPSVTSPSSTTFTGSCSEASTVTSCGVSLSYAVDGAGSTTATASATSCSTITGCSVTGQTATSEETSTASSDGCWAYDYSLSGYENISDDDDDKESNMRKRHLAGRVVYEPSPAKLNPGMLYYGAAPEAQPIETQPALLPRAPAKPLPRLQSCSLTGPAGTTAVSTLTVPAYPQANSLEAWPTPGAIWWFVPTPVAPPGGGCPVMTYTQFPDASALMAAPVVRQVTSGAPALTYQFNIQKNVPRVNPDHVFELKFVKQFFEGLLDSGAISCTDLNDFFMTEDTNSGTGVSRLQTIWNQLPSNDRPDFCGMDAHINGVKGSLFGPGLAGLPRNLLDPARLQMLNDIAVAVDLTNNPQVAALFQKVNVRVFEAFRGIDQIASSSSACSQPFPSPAPSQGWAGAYSSYMVSIVSNRNVEITNALSTIIAGFTSTADASGNLNVIGRGIQAFTSKYPTASVTFNEGALLAWPTTSALAIARRQEAPACTARPASSGDASTSGSAPASASASASKPSQPESTTEGDPLPTTTEPPPAPSLEPKPEPGPEPEPKPEPEPEPEPEPKPEYATGTCRFHIWEGQRGFANPALVEVTLFDAENKEIGKDAKEVKWGESLSLTSKLPHTVEIIVVNGLKLRKRISIPPREGGVSVQGWPLDFKYSDQSWSTSDTDSAKKPYCNVGGWDNGNFGDFLGELVFGDSKIPNRQIDCFFEC